MSTTTNKMTLKKLRQLISEGHLYFDFSDDREDDKKDYEESGYEWKDEYSYYKITEVVSKYDHDLMSRHCIERRYHNCYVFEEEDGSVDYFLFRIKDIKQIDENHYEVFDVDSKKNVFKLIVR